MYIYVCVCICLCVLGRFTMPCKIFFSKVPKMQTPHIVPNASRRLNTKNQVNLPIFDPPPPILNVLENEHGDSLISIIGFCTIAETVLNAPLILITLINTSTPDLTPTPTSDPITYAYCLSLPLTG